jgi:hypothetical protein
MKTWRAVGGPVCLMALFFGISVTLRAQMGVLPVSRIGLTPMSVFANNGAAWELITNLLAEPPPELSVPAINFQAPSLPGTYWTLKGATPPLPFNLFPELPVYAVDTNGNFVIDDRSVDYRGLAIMEQAEAQLTGLTNGTAGTYPIDTNGLYLEVPTDSLTDAAQFKVILHNTIQGQSYDFLTKADLLYPMWATELTVTGAVGSATTVQLPMNSRTNLFVQARLSPASSFYVVSLPLSQVVILGDTVTFSVGTEGGTNLTFQWLFNGTPIDGATNRSYTIESVRLSDRGSFSVMISDGAQSVVTPAAQLSVNQYASDSLHIVLLSQRQDYRFKSGRTYYIFYRTHLYGDTVIEPGVVIKFCIDSTYELMGYTNASLVIMGTLTCPTDPYYPAILTSIDDGWNGRPWPIAFNEAQTAQNGVAYLDMAKARSSSISNLRFCFADWGVTTPEASRRLDVWDCQFVQCNYGVVNLVEGAGAVDSLHNVLFRACGAAVGAAGNPIVIEAEQVTADVGNFYLTWASPERVTLTNSIIFGSFFEAIIYPPGGVVFNPDPTNFQSVAAGNYYLAATSPLHGAGTANISSRLRAEFGNKTTYAPMAIPPFTEWSGNITLGPQVPRDIGGTLDPGYHYAVLDYTVAGIYLMNGCSVTVLPGTALGMRMDFLPEEDDYTYFGFVALENSSFVSRGTPARPNTFVDLQQVQEGPQWPVFASFIPNFHPIEPGAQPPVLDFRFSNFYLGMISLFLNMAGPSGVAPSYHFCAGTTLWYGELTLDSAVNLSLRDCQFHGGQIDLGACDFGFYGLALDYPLAGSAVNWNHCCPTGLRVEG